MFSLFSIHPLNAELPGHLLDRTLSEGTKLSKSDTDLADFRALEVSPELLDQKRIVPSLLLPAQGVALLAFLPSPPLSSLLSVLMMLVAPFKGPWALPRTKD